MGKVLDTISMRRSVRKFTSQEIEDYKLESLLKAAMDAPTARNDQNVFYVLVNDQAIKNQILIELDIEKNYYDCKAILFSFEYKEDYLNEYNVGAAIENVLLAAEELHLNCCWIHSSLKALDTEKGRKLLKECLSLDKEYKPLDTVAIGYSESIMPQKKERKHNLDKII